MGKTQFLLVLGGSLLDIMTWTFFGSKLSADVVRRLRASRRLFISLTWTGAGRSRVRQNGDSNIFKPQAYGFHQTLGIGVEYG
jgi:hypothetical protein